MKTIPVNASRSYCVHIGAGLLDTLGKEAAALCTMHSNTMAANVHEAALKLLEGIQ